MSDHSHDHEHSDARVLSSAAHDHVFLGRAHARNERRTWLVIALTTTMMVVEIAAGTLFGSMALVADGWHMSTHAAALLIAALAYRFARRHARDVRFTFGTGKLGDLAGFASAIILSLVALLIAWESLQRLAQPIEIEFTQALVVAVIGLAVNLGCAWLLHDGDARGHAHAHDAHHGYGNHDHDPHHDHATTAGHEPPTDNNLRAAYMHVMADALTSVLAIAALLAGRAYGWLWLDPVIGIVGAVVIAYWAVGLMRDSGGVLLDFSPSAQSLPNEIRSRLEDEHTRVTDLHVWQLGPGHHGAIIAVSTAKPAPVAHYKDRLATISTLSHLTVEVEAMPAR